MATGHYKLATLIEDSDSDKESIDDGSEHADSEEA